MRVSSRRLLSLAIAAVLSAPVAAQQDAAIDAYVSALTREGQFSGVVLVARGANVLFEKGYGMADFERRAPNTINTQFAIASVTKSLTGIVARTLAERGVLDLNAPISRWLPDFPNASRITATMLLGHRSGIPHRVTTLGDERRAQTAESMVALVGKAHMVSEPGGQRLYSSAGYSVLARVLELASGKSYAALVHELVLDPAGAKATTDATEPEVRLPRARGHFWTAEGPMAAADKQLSFLVGAGSLWSRPADLLKVVRRIVDGGFSPGATAGARNADGSMLWTGFSNGSFAIVQYTPSTDLTLVVTSNLLTGAIDLITRDGPRIAAGEAVAPPQAPHPSVVPLTADQQRRLEGTYNYVGNEQALRFVTPTAAVLGGEYMLIPTGPNALFAPQNYVEYGVVSDSTGKITSLQIPGASAFTIRRVR